MNDATEQPITIENLVYRHDADQNLIARLYRPGGTGPHPAIVEVHGGAWITGDLMQNADMLEELAASGILVLSIEFRMPPVAAYPASIADVNYAIRWLKSRARDYNIAGGKVGGLGSSSGGHQIMLSALRPHDPRYAAIVHPDASGIDASLAYVISCWGVLDPLTRYRMATAKGMERIVESHHIYWGTESAMDDGNPQRILDHAPPSALPPALLIQGTRDDNVPAEMATRFADSYRKAGGQADLTLYEGQPHAFIRNDLRAPDARDALHRIKTFIHANG